MTALIEKEIKRGREKEWVRVKKQKKYTSEIWRKKKMKKELAKKKEK